MFSCHSAIAKSLTGSLGVPKSKWPINPSPVFLTPGNIASHCKVSVSVTVRCHINHSTFQTPEDKGRERGKVWPEVLQRVGEWRYASMRSWLPPMLIRDEPSSSCQENDVLAPFRRSQMLELEMPPFAVRLN